ncbi:hypothetical protein AY633_12770 [Planococcus maritimus]|nr:hypothetical protein AY633_12770 [Planococcus maritimus]
MGASPRKASDKLRKIRLFNFLDKIEKEGSGLLFFMQEYRCPESKVREDGRGEGIGQCGQVNIF